MRMGVSRRLRASPARVESLEARALLAADSPFTFVVMPDTQMYSWRNPEIFSAQTQWIVANRAAQNVAFLTHVGDVVQNPNLTSEWTHADEYMDRLDATPLPYSVAIGNHDFYGGSSAGFVQWFGASRYVERSWYGGASANQLNHWQVFTAGPWNFLHITLEFNPPAAAMSWAQSVIDTHPGMATMITTHDYLTGSGTRSSLGTRVWDGLVRTNPQIFAVFGGHYTAEAHRLVSNDAGKPVIEMVVDFQGMPNGGDGYLRLLKFYPGQNRIDATTFSPWLNDSYTDANSQFSITMDFAGRFGPPLGSGVVSGEEVLVPSTQTTNSSRQAPVHRPAFAARKIVPARRRVDVLHETADTAP
jgi:hypothetical protein